MGLEHELIQIFLKLKLIERFKRDRSKHLCKHHCKHLCKHQDVRNLHILIGIFWDHSKHQHRKHQDVQPMIFLRKQDVRRHQGNQHKI